MRPLDPSSKCIVADARIDLHPPEGVSTFSPELPPDAAAGWVALTRAYWWRYIKKYCYI